ncbi:hypothetical protein KC573_04675, partial [candidate division WWE3 bacterium]|nr:hypothetical protein [candidate division WWE3 bacterium]
VTIKHSIKNGVYYLEKSTYTFKRSEYRFEILADNEFQLFTVANGREVTVDQELFQLQSKYLSAETLVSLAKEIKQKYFFNND